MPRIPFILPVALLLSGCVSQPTESIPRRGEVVAQGTGQLSFRAPEPGLVSVYDVNTDSIIHSSAVTRGSVIALNPQAGNITVTDPDPAGTEIVHTRVEKSHPHAHRLIPVGA